MKIILFTTFLLMASTFLSAQSSPIILWENGAPLAVGKEAVDIPTLTSYIPTKDKATGAAVIVLPGGGYSHLSDIKEGSAVA